MKDLINPGDKVRIGTEIGEVIKIDELSDGTKQYRVAFATGSPKSFLSPPTTLIKILSPIEAAKNKIFDEPYKYDLLTQATRLSLAYEYDHLLSLSNSRTNLEPYQVEAVYQILTSFRQRYLIADDVGLGKTIETGMVFKELEARGRAKRVLIIVPAALQYQWQKEMGEKFDSRFWIYDSNKVKDLKRGLSKGANVWEHDDRIITSIDYAKREDVLPALERTNWDLIIFDEAHKLSASKYGEKIYRSQRYKLSEALCKHSDNILLLSATPHKGDSYAFYAIISLADPYLFKDENHIKAEKLNSIMIRRGKHNLTDENGRPVFTHRSVKTIPVTFTPAEKELYDAVTSYVMNEYNAAKKIKNKTVGFAMVIMQKRMVSSIGAIRASLKRRLNALKTQKVILTKEELRELKDLIDDPDSLTDQERNELENKLLVLSLATDKRGLELEIKKLEELVQMAEAIIVDTKSKELLDYIDKLLSADPKEKVLVFTEYKDTLDYLEGILKDYKLNKIYGAMDMDARERAKEEFSGPKINLMLATDAAGEGINLQFCHLMINYELPWNPNRIDQRIGRLHRYGQKRDVKVFNLQVENTREGVIFIRLQEKIAEIERHLGGRISDILGELLEGVKLEDLIMEAIAKNKEVEVTFKELENAVEERKKMLEKVESHFLMKLKDFDLQSAIKVIEQSQERSKGAAITNKDIQNFVKLFLETHGGRLEKTKYKEICRIITPKHITDGRVVMPKYEQATFEKEIAKRMKPDEVDFVAFGHPLLNRIVEHCRNRDGGFGGGVTIKVIESEELKGKSGVVFNYKLEYTDAQGEILSEDLTSIFVDVENKIENDVLGYILALPSKVKIKDYLDKEEISKLLKGIDYSSELAMEYAREAANNKLEIVKQKRQKEVAIQLEDVNKYFKAKIEEENERLGEFEKRLKKGEDMNVAIQSSKGRLSSLKDQYQSRIKELGNKRIIYSRAPELLNLALILFVEPKFELKHDKA